MAPPSTQAYPAFFALPASHYLRSFPNDDGDDDDLLCLLIGVSVPSHTNISKKETTIQAM